MRALHVPAGRTSHAHAGVTAFFFSFILRSSSFSSDKSRLSLQQPKQFSLFLLFPPWWHFPNEKSKKKKPPLWILLVNHEWVGCPPQYNLPKWVGLRTTIARTLSTLLHHHLISLSLFSHRPNSEYFLQHHKQKFSSWWF